MADESALIERVLRRDEGAFRALYRAHTRSLYAVALRMTGGSETDAEDVVQETWRRAVRELERFEARSSLRTWLRAIAVRCALEVGRVGRLEEPGNDEPADPRTVDGAAGRVDLERALATLAPGFRAVLLLHDVEGYRHEDIATLLGISEGTSKSQLSRARARMRAALGGAYVGE